MTMDTRAQSRVTAVLLVFSPVIIAVTFLAATRIFGGSQRVGLITAGASMAIILVCGVYVASRSKDLETTDSSEEATVEPEQIDESSTAGESRDDSNHCEASLRSEPREPDDQAADGRTIERAEALQDEVRDAFHTGDLETATRALSELDSVLDTATGEKKQELDELQGDVAEDRERFEEQASDRVGSCLQFATGTQSEAVDHLVNEDIENARHRVDMGLAACEYAASLDKTYDLDHGEDIEAARLELSALTYSADAVKAAADKAADHKESISRALKKRDYETASRALDTLEAMLETLEAYSGTQPTIDEYRSDFEDLQKEVITKQAAERVDSKLSDASSKQTQAEEAIADRKYDNAATHLEAALDALEEADRLDEGHDLEVGDTIAAKREDLQLLLDKASPGAADRLAEQLEAAEAAIARGIERRDANDLRSAVDAFSSAVETYSDAVDLASDQDLPERWEVEQRHSMVKEYLNVTQTGLDERRRLVQTGVERTLDDAESTLERAEQHHEVDDTVSARESLAEAVVRLDEAKQLMGDAVIDDRLQSRYEDLVARADTLNEQLPDEDESDTYRTRNLVQSLQMLATKLGESPTPAFVNRYGEYPADAYLDAFGSWPEAIAAANLDPIDEASRNRRTYTRVQILDAVCELATELGHPPSKVEMNDHGLMSSTTVETRFAGWETALELAGLAGDDKAPPVEPAGAESTDADIASEGDPPPNELAELYEAFASLESLLAAIIESDGEVEYGNGSLLADWYDAIHDLWAGTGPDDAPNYGEQQYHRNDFSMADYRSIYGDGERVTSFHVIETEPLKQEHRELLQDRGVIDSDESFALPVAPDQNKRLPVTVLSDDDLSQVRDLLAEFPNWPDADLSPGKSVHAEGAVTPEETSLVGDDKAGPDGPDPTEAGAASEDPTRPELTAVIQDLDRELDRLPKTTDVQQDDEQPSVAAFRSEFGSWDEALEAAGIDKRAGLLSELRRVAEKVGSEPTMSQMNDVSVYSTQMYARFFGSWTAAKDQVDFDAILGRDQAKGTEAQGDSETSGETDETDDIVDRLMSDMGLDPHAEATRE